MVYGNLILEQQEELDESNILSILGEAGLLLEFFDEDDGIITEGENIDTLNVFKQCKKEYKSNIKKAKSLLKAGNKDEAKKVLNEAEKNIKKAQSNIKSIKDDSLTSSVLGSLFAGWLDICYSSVTQFSLIGYMAGASVASLSTFIKIPTSIVAGSIVLANVSSVILSIKNIILMIKQITRIIKDIEDGDDTAQALNMWRNRLLVFTDDMNKNIKKLKDSI